MQRLQIFWSSLIGTKLKQIGVWRNVGKRRSLPRCCGLLNVRELGHAVASRQTNFRGTRRMPVAGFAKHLIFYQSSERKILVLRVVHGARDLESLFSE